ncbi:hypothetical protein PZ938_02975 [Luteipulveratus sp. YIM 133132]|uniref:hypothetical protein n=1 Tax=Luteipulveratus flavus TaxID=3031728 RepID=UPI0023B0BC8A|nr:hypothetical protein [Luteipulveratus sp. YIM 133132]MDE9364555.1 hypothetical protein [Luteipulveratus sp. YIM 133132]
MPVADAVRSRLRRLTTPAAGGQVGPALPSPTPAAPRSAGRPPIVLMPAAGDRAYVEQLVTAVNEQYPPEAAAGWWSRWLSASPAGRQALENNLLHFPAVLDRALALPPSERED